MSASSGPTEETLKIRRIIALLGILLIIIGQYLIYATPVNSDRLPVPMIILSASGLVVFILSFYIPVPSALQARVSKISVSPKVFWILTAIIFSILTAFSMLLFSQSNQNVYLPVLVTWFAAGIFYIFAFRGDEFKPGRARQWLAVHRTELMMLGGITLLAAFLRFYQLGVYPRILDGDEGLMGLFAQSTLSGHYANPFALWENFGALYLQAINFIFGIFGKTPFALRFLPALSGTLAVPALYLLARQIGGKRVAAIGSFMLAISHTHIHFSRIASVGYIHSTWLVPLELYLLLSGLEKKKSWRTAAGGALLGIHFSVYLTSQIILGMIIVFVLITFLLMRKWFIPVVRQVAAFFGGLAIMILPELFYIFKNPSEFFNRLSQDGTFQSGWLEQTMALTGQSSVQVLAGRVLHAFLSLFYYPAKDFYGSSIPMLTLFTAVFFLIGLVIALRRVRSPGFLLLNGYFWAPVLAIGIFSVPPSADSYRMLIVLPPALLLAGMAIDETLELVGFGWSRARNVYAFMAGALMISLAIFNLWAYYGDFVGQCRYGGNPAGRFASYLGSYAKSVEEGSPIYLLSDDTFFYGSHASTDFLSGQRKITNLPDPIDIWPGVSGETVIANPTRIPELETWIHAHPGGQANYVRDCSNLILLGYRLP
jgi:4-amino-4-deoxy-L-arabinose transferase-like glycosyltransferase